MNCLFCEKTFKLSWRLRRHQKTHLPWFLRDFSCGSCKKICRSATELFDHFKVSDHQQDFTFIQKLREEFITKHSDWSDLKALFIKELMANSNYNWLDTVCMEPVSPPECSAQHARDDINPSSTITILDPVPVPVTISNKRKREDEELPEPISKLRTEVKDLTRAVLQLQASLDRMGSDLRAAIEATGEANQNYTKSVADTLHKNLGLVLNAIEEQNSVKTFKKISHLICENIKD